MILWELPTSQLFWQQHLFSAQNETQAYDRMDSKLATAVRLLFSTVMLSKLQNSIGNKWVCSLMYTWRSIGVWNITLYWCLHTARSECRRHPALNRPLLKNIFVFCFTVCQSVLFSWTWKVTITFYSSASVPFPRLSYCGINTNTNVSQFLLLALHKLALCKPSILSE